MILDFRTLVTDALEHLENKRPAEAEKNIRAALAMNPRDDQLLNLLGVALIRQQREEEAIEPLSAATPPSALKSAKRLGLVGAVKTGPRDVAARHANYLKAKLKRGAARSR